MKADYADLMSGYFVARPDTSRGSMLGSLSLMKSAKTGSRFNGFTSDNNPSPSFKDMGSKSVLQLRPDVRQQEQHKHSHSHTQIWFNCSN